MQTYQLLITEPGMTRDDFVMLTFFSKADGTLENGIYTVTDEIGDHCIAPGTIDFGGQMFLSWYGDLSEVDNEGYNTKIAPLMGGTVTIADGGAAGTKTVTFNVLDDKGNAITGSWTGPIQAFGAEAAIARKVRVR